MEPDQLAVVRPDTGPLDPYLLREQFPLLHRRVHGKPLAYLDNAASTQKPRGVIQLVEAYYRNHYSNVHRGIHRLSAEATEAYEEARDRIARLLGARDRREVIFTSGTTNSINLVAHSYGGRFIGEGDEIVLTQMEHHSNIVPWQLLCEERGAHLKVIPIDDDGDIVLSEYERLLTTRTRIVGIVHVSNALGTVNPVREMIATAHARDVPVLVDGAQAVPHGGVDVRDLDCDFYVFSGHKVYGPTGIGALYGKREHLLEMPPYQGGGDMILSVSFDGTTFNEPPHRFEAGTPNIEGAIGLAAALDYVDAIGLEAIAAHEEQLLDAATDAVLAVPGTRLVGAARQRAAALSFVMEGIHPHDIGTILDSEGVAVRAGHHCAQPVMKRYGVSATVRASFALYNTDSEIDALARGLTKVREVFG